MRWIHLALGIAAGACLPTQAAVSALEISGASFFREREISVSLLSGDVVFLAPVVMLFAHRVGLRSPVALLSWPVVVFDCDDVAFWSPVVSSRAPDAVLS